MNVGTSVLCGLLAFSILAQAQTNQPKACLMIPQTQVATSAALQQALAYKENADQITQLSTDSRHLNQISSSIALVAGTTGIIIATSTMGYIAGAPASKMIAPLLNSTLGKIYVIKSSALVSLGAAALATPLGTISETLGIVGAVSGGILGAAVASPIDSYVLGSAVYSFVTLDNKKMFLKDLDINTTESALKSLMNQYTLEIENHLENPPSNFDNATSLGRKMRDQMAAIAELAQKRATAANAILKINEARLVLLKKACSIEK